MRAGRLHRVHRGVYAVGHPGLSSEGRWMAAVLACGDGAVLSHRSAAELWELLPAAKGDVHVTLPGRGRPRQAPGHPPAPLPLADEHGHDAPQAHRGHHPRPDARRPAPHDRPALHRKAVREAEFRTCRSASPDRPHPQRARAGIPGSAGAGACRARR